MFRLTLFVAPILASTLALSAIPVAAQTKPNILVIMGDDIGIWNLSTYHQGMMGDCTPNIDRLASEGAKLMTYSRTICRRMRPNILIIMAASQIGDEYEGHMPRSGITAGYRDHSKFA